MDSTSANDSGSNTFPPRTLNTAGNRLEMPKMLLLLLLLLSDDVDDAAAAAACGACTGEGVASTTTTTIEQPAATNSRNKVERTKLIMLHCTALNCTELNCTVLILHYCSIITSLPQLTPNLLLREE